MQPLGLRNLSLPSQGKPLGGGAPPDPENTVAPTIRVQGDGNAYPDSYLDLDTPGTWTESPSLRYKWVVNAVAGGEMEEVEPLLMTDEMLEQGVVLREYPVGREDLAVVSNERQVLWPPPSLLSPPVIGPDPVYTNQTLEVIAPSVWRWQTGFNSQYWRKTNGSYAGSPGPLDVSGYAGESLEWFEEATNPGGHAAVPAESNEVTVQLA